MTPEKSRKYLPIAEALANLSKDTSTKVGALILGPDMEIRSSGWNGAVRGCSADEDHRFQQRPEKYYCAEHAERNAIYNAVRVGTPLNNCVLIVTAFPCMDCARAVVQAGIKEVWAPRPDPEFMTRWKEHIERACALFDECGVESFWL